MIHQNSQNRAQTEHIEEIETVAAPNRAPKPPKPIRIDPLRGSVMRDRAHPWSPKKGWYWRIKERGRAGRSLGGMWDHGDPEKVRARMLEILRSKMQTGVVAEGMATVADLLDVFLAERARAVRAGTIQAGTFLAHRTSAKRIAPLIGHKRIRDVQKTDIEEMRTELIARGYAENTAYGSITALKAAWNWARPRYIQRDFPGIRAPGRGKGKREKRWPEPDEIEAALSNLNGWQMVLTAVMFFCGCRIGEVSGVLWDNVDLFRGRIYICNDGAGARLGRAKTGRRELPIVPELVAILRAHREAIEANPAKYQCPRYLLGIRPKSSQNSKYRDALYAAQRTAGVRKFLPHDLRRAAVMRLVRANVPLITAAAFFGQSVEVMAKHYATATSQDRRDVADALNPRKTTEEH